MKAYFKDIQGRADAGARFDYDFDQFYLCLMVGLDDGQLGLEADLEPAEFVKGYTAAYKPYAPVIAGLLVEAEIRRQGVPTSKEALQKEFSDLLDVDNAGTHLNEDGTKLLSRYAVRGFELIRDRIPEPRTLEDFLVAYHKQWGPTTEAQTAGPPPASKG